MEFSNAYKRWTTARTAFEHVSQAAFPADTPDVLTGTRARCGMLQTKSAGLNLWCAWRRAYDGAAQLGLAPIADALQSGALQGKAADAFETAYADWWSNQLISANPLLRSFTAHEHADRIVRFRQLDDELAKLSQKYIRARLCGQIPAKDSALLEPGLRALRHQLTLTRPRKALRELMGELGPALTKLAPCLLMSPLSVAQFLPADTAPFDLIIFDEASQITPWDAVGAIARGRQVIVAGDPKQMPPTSFFDKSASVDDFDDDTEEDQESILDECLAAGIRSHRLTWHYRSKNENLIAFSNHRYYDGDLITFPAPITGNVAIQCVRVQGAWSRGKLRTNQIEAEAIVAEAVRRLTDPAFVDERGGRLSLAIVTLNAEQQKLVEDLLDKARQADPDIEPYFAEDHVEPTIVKNLETVQGDERDLIILGVGYGPETPGAPSMSMNLGPLNRNGGWRRLNVAITRARREMMVFASFPPHLLDLNRTSSRAVRDLKHFLEFAERGPVALSEAVSGSLGTHESPFEQAVAQGLESRGWTVTPQVGVSRYRIDLGVVHPQRPGDFLAGVECDGASYHSAATARDRDKVREGVLRQLGWRIVRIWSTEWWVDKAGALDRLDSQLKAILANEPGAEL